MAQDWFVPPGETQTRYFDEGSQQWGTPVAGGPLDSNPNVTPNSGRASTYTPQQIKQYITEQGIGNDPHAMYRAAMQFGVSPEQVDVAMGYAPGTSAGWIQQQGYGAQQPAAQPAAQPAQPAPQPAPNAYMPQGGTQGGQAAPYTGTSGNPYMQGKQSPIQQSPMQQGGQQPMRGNPYMGGFAPPWDNANPNTQWMAGQISQGVTDHLQRNLLPGIRSSASRAGGLGGSRQGIAEGTAIGDSAKGLSTALAGLYGGQYNQDRSYGLQNDALDLGAYNSNQNWMRQGQQDQIGLVDKMLGWNSQGLGTATQVKDQPFNNWQRFVAPATRIGGMGGTESQQQQGNPYLGAIGGAMAGYGLYNNWGK